MADVSIIIRATDATGRAFGAVQSSLGKLQSRAQTLTRQFFSLRTAIAGAGAGLLAKSFIDAASTAEQYGTRLSVLLGSVEEGNRLFKAMADYASRVPFEYEQIMGAATSLSGVMKGGVDEIGEWMPLIGDLAAATGLSIEETTSQIIRMYSSGAASADMFRERGTLAMLGFQAGVSYSADETRKKLMASWKRAGSQFRGATYALADDWKGLTSMMSDKWFKFRTDVMNAAPFLYLKSSLDLLNRHLDETAGDTEDTATRIGEGIVNIFESVALGAAGAADALMPAMRSLWGVAQKAWSAFDDLSSRHPWLIDVGIIGVLYGGKKGALLIGALSFVAKDAENIAKAMALAAEGEIKWMDIITYDADQLAAVIAVHEANLDHILGKAEEKKRSGGILADIFGGEPEAGSYKDRLKDIFSEIHKNMEKLKKDGKKAAGGVKEGLEEALTVAEELSKEWREGFGGIQSPFDEGGMLDTERWKKKVEEMDEPVSFYLNKWAKDASRVNEQLADTITGTFDLISYGLGSAVADAIVYGESLGDALKGVMQSTAAFVIQSLIQMGVQRLILSILNTTLGLKEHITKMTHLTTQTYAGAFAWAVPIMGPLAPAFAAGMTAEMLGGSTAAGAAGAGVAAAQGVAHGGLGYVPREGSYILQRGEMVLAPEQNRELMEFLKSGGGKATIVHHHHYNIGKNVYAIDDESFSRHVNGMVQDNIVAKGETNRVIRKYTR